MHDVLKPGDDDKRLGPLRVLYDMMYSETSLPERETCAGCRVAAAGVDRSLGSTSGSGAWRRFPDHPGTTACWPMACGVSFPRILDQEDEE